MCVFVCVCVVRFCISSHLKSTQGCIDVIVIKIKPRASVLLGRMRRECNDFLLWFVSDDAVWFGFLEWAAHQEIVSQSSPDKQTMNLRQSHMRIHYKDIFIIKNIYARCAFRAYSYVSVAYVWWEREGMCNLKLCFFCSCQTDKLPLGWCQMMKKWRRHVLMIISSRFLLLSVSCIHIYKKTVLSLI